MQLSHSQEYSDESTPLNAIFVPTRITGAIQDHFVVDAAAGEEMSIIVTHSKEAGKVYERVFGCGNNLKGQLGVNRVSHVLDLTLIPDISGLEDSSSGDPLYID